MMTDFSGYKKVKLPGGKIGRFPESMSWEDIQDNLQKQFPDTEKSNQQQVSSQNNIQKQDELSPLHKIGADIDVAFANMGHKLLNTPSDIARFAESKAPTGALPFGLKASDVPRQKDYDYAQLRGLPKEQNLSDKVIQGLVGQVPALLMPELKLGKIGSLIDKIPAVGKLGKSIIQKGTPIAAYEATQADENPSGTALKAGAATVPFSVASHLIRSTNPWVGLAGRALASSAGGYAGYEGAKALGADSLLSKAAGALVGSVAGAWPGNPKLIARDKMLAGVNPEIAIPKLEAAKRLGLSYVTPGEVGGNPFTAGMQGTVGKEGGGQLLYEKGLGRLKSEENAINDFRNAVYNPSTHDKIKESLYKEAYKKVIPFDPRKESYFSKLRDNKIYQAAVSKMESSPAYQESLNGVPENSIEYLDHVKQSLDDMIEAAPKKEARIIKNTQKQLIKQMDEVSPEYKAARSLAEREITRRENIEKALNKGNMTGTNFFRRLLENKDKFDELRHHVRDVTGAQQQLDDMKMVFGDLINPPTNRTQAGHTRNNMHQPRNSQVNFMDKMKEFLTGKQLDKASVEIMTNPNWIDELKNVGKISNMRQRFAAAVDVLGKAAGSIYTEKKNKEKNDKLMELELNTAQGYQK